MAALTILLMVAAAGRAGASTPAVTIPTDQVAGSPLMGLGVEWDPYDHFQPTPADWGRTFQRVDYMHPGVIRVVEPAWDYFRGYDASHNPTYRWSSRHLEQLLTILRYAKSRGIKVILGDWLNPMIHGDPRVPADFLQALHDTYGFTNIAFYDPVNEPNDQTGCAFDCWTGELRALSAEFAADGINRWLKLIGPGDANSWDDTAQAQDADRAYGLDNDNPIGGDVWVTQTLHSVPNLIGAYDTHRYATIWGIEHGVYGDQMRTRREQISYLDSPHKPYFEAEVGMVAREASPFAAGDSLSPEALHQVLDPSVEPDAGTFVDSQPHIKNFAYGVWMADMMIQAIDSGLSGASAWDLDDAMHVGGQYGSQNLKQWGFWNSFGGQDGYPASDLEPRPWYYAWSVLSRAFPAGSQALLVPSTSRAGLRVAAAKLPVKGRVYRLSIAVVNDSKRPASIRIRIPSVLGRPSLDRFNYFAQERPVDSARLPVPSATTAHARLAGGIRIALPGRGMVVLSSTAPVRLRQAPRHLVDELTTWRHTSSHTRKARLAHANRTLFNGDGSRAASVASTPQSLTYRARNISSFRLKVYFQGRRGLRVFRSHDGRRWKAVALASTNPAPAMGGRFWYMVELVTRGRLPPGVNRLKIQLSNQQTELSQVAIGHR